MKKLPVHATETKRPQLANHEKDYLQPQNATGKNRSIPRRRLPLSELGTIYIEVMIAVF